MILPNKGKYREGLGEKRREKERKKGTLSRVHSNRLALLFIEVVFKKKRKKAFTRSGLDNIVFIIHVYCTLGMMGYHIQPFTQYIINFELFLCYLFMFGKKWGGNFEDLILLKRNRRIMFAITFFELLSKKSKKNLVSKKNQAGIGHRDDV